MRIWIGRLLVVVILANLAVWSSPALAETLERIAAAGVADPADAPHEVGSGQCQHGCASHCGQHVQWHTSSDPVLPVAAAAGIVPISFRQIPPGVEPPLPFRPPLGAQL